MTLSDIIARIEARGVEMPETRRMLTWYDGPEVVYGEVLTALDEATTEVERLRENLAEQVSLNLVLQGIAKRRQSEVEKWKDRAEIGA